MFVAISVGKERVVAVVALTLRVQLTVEREE